MQKTSRIAQSFNHLAPSIHFRHAQKPSSEAVSGQTLNPQDPDVILLFTWTSARHGHIAKYTTEYAKLYPSSAMMVITTSANDLLYRSSGRKQRGLSPAIHTLLSQKLTNNILIHCFSEGGSHKAVQFAKAYLQATGARLQVSAICLDSTPGTLQPSQIPNMWKSIAPKTFGAKILSLATSYAFVVSYLIRSKNLFAEARRALDDNQLWDTKAPRCYLYSEADKLVGCQGIIRHALKARRRGTPVSVIRFKSSAHCAHIKEDENKYWAAVQKTWDGREPVAVVTDEERLVKDDVTILVCKLLLAGLSRVDLSWICSCTHQIIHFEHILIINGQDEVRSDIGTWTGNPSAELKESVNECLGQWTLSIAGKPWNMSTEVRLGIPKKKCESSHSADCAESEAVHLSSSFLARPWC